MSSPTFEHQRKFYETYWKDSGRLSIDEKCRRRFVLSALSRFRPAKSLRILDVGCGRGWMTNALSRYGEVLGVDLFVEEARRRYPKAAFQEMNIVSQFPKGVYDVVVTSEVLEHLPRENQAEHIRSIAGALSRGGLLILTTPNKPQLESLVRKLKNTSHMQPIENWLSQRELREMIQPFFFIEHFGSARFYPIFLFSNLFLRVPYHVFYDYLGAYRLIDKFLESTDWGTYFTLVGRKL
ncbi:MAG: methyltransferase domain-containing protein [Candidatus Yanofskybacteria bacterium]|nr:methyltransferase domain-containing protein [Candidatus Yanofskybacteria bacterium]